MKKIVYIFSVILMMTSCKSIEKMVEQGKYDEAIVYAAKKLHGEKNKKTKYVEALETAYHKVTAEDMNQIKFLSESGYANKWDRVYQLYAKIDSRQAKITPFLPLISEDGYAAHFKFVRTHDKLNEVAELAAEEHYNKAINLLKEYDSYGEKKTAREAYAALENVERYISNYRDKAALKREALAKGTTNVAVTVKSDHFVYAGDISTYVLRNFDIDRLNSFWTKYDVARNYTEKADYHVILKVDEVLLGAERERVDHFHERAFVEVGRQNVIGPDGRVLADSLGNILTEPIENEVFATVTEIKREKSAQIYSEIIIKDERTNRIRRSIPVSVTEDFADYMCTFTGDKRALPANSVKRLDTYLAPFPHDLQMIENMSYQLRDVAYSKIEREMRDIIGRA